MEQNTKKGKHVQRQNKLKGANWEQLDYMNDDNMNKYCKLTVYPH